MPKKQFNYTEGTCFLVPLREGGYARGVVARMNGNGIVFGYFFGPKLEKKEDGRIDSTLRPTNAIVSSKFGGLGLLKGEWPVIGKIEPWIRADWPLPPLFRADERAQIGFISHYDDNSLRCVREEKIKLGKIDTSKFPEDSLWGYGAAEIHLTKLIG
jgi:Immunity protein 26